MHPSPDGAPTNEGHGREGRLSAARPHAGGGRAAAASLLVLGTGCVGGALLEHLSGPLPLAQGDDGVAVRVVGVVNRRGCAFDERGLDGDVRQRAASFHGAAPPDVDALLDRLASLPTPILVDCTAQGGMEALYARAFRRGVHVVAANKKPLAAPLAARDALFAAARRHGCAFAYETTVGAALPVLGTLRDLVRTGDDVRTITGALSGTLGFISDAVMEGVALSRAVAIARERGYTEPDPRDDLDGRDVARKALILARELGLPRDVDDVAIEPFVPEGVLRAPTLSAFWRLLEAEDGAMAARVSALRAEGRVLRYLAEVRRDAIVVGPQAVDARHPAARLRGAESLVAFSTARYAHSPLAVQGPGAGGAVTAAGVLGDVLAIAARAGRAAA